MENMCSSFNVSHSLRVYSTFTLFFLILDKFTFFTTAIQYWKFSLEGEQMTDFNMIL